MNHHHASCGGKSTSVESNLRTRRIACAQKFSQCHFRLPGIVNDPFCCTTLLANAANAFECPGQPKITPYPWRIWTPFNTWFLGPTRLTVPNGISIGSVVFAWQCDRPITLLAASLDAIRLKIPANCERLLWMSLRWVGRRLRRPFGHRADTLLHSEPYSNVTIDLRYV